MGWLRVFVGVDYESAGMGPYPMQVLSVVVDEVERVLTLRRHFQLASSKRAQRCSSRSGSGREARRRGKRISWPWIPCSA